METKRFYFTFGTDPDYPYGRNDYVLVEAQNLNQAIDIFTMIHPKRPGSDCVNCAFWYDEEQFLPYIEKHYHGAAPVETITLTVKKGA